MAIHVEFLKNIPWSAFQCTIRSSSTFLFARTEILKSLDSLVTETSLVVQERVISCAHFAEATEDEDENRLRAKMTNIEINRFSTVKI